jgi:uncharacterized protein YndB with AHSA1/START domain
MSRFECEATIARPAQDIWTYAADTLRHPDWMTVADARIVRGEGGQVGDRGRERLLFGPFKLDAEFEVVEADRGRRIVWRSVDNPWFEGELSLDLEPVGPTAARATYRSVFQLRGGWRLLMPLVAMEGPAGVCRELHRLKANVETAVSGG